jgi:hypothetical protein
MAQSRARYSDINLTMSAYTDVVLEDHVEAMGLLPQLPVLPPSPSPTKGAGRGLEMCQDTRFGSAVLALKYKFLVRDQTTYHFVSPTA